MSEKEKLLNTLFNDPKRKHWDIKFLRGTSATVTEDQLCAEANRAIAAFESGELKAIEKFEEDFVVVDVKTLQDA